MTNMELSTAADGGEVSGGLKIAAADAARADHLRAEIDRVNGQLAALHGQKVELTRALAAVWTGG